MRDGTKILPGWRDFHNRRDSMVALRRNKDLENLPKFVTDDVIAC